MMRKAYDAVATVGTYTDKESGQEKKRRVNVGVVLKDDTTGRMCLKIEAIPVSRDWSGFIDFFEPNQDQSGRPPQQQRRPQTQQQQPQDFDDDIPF